LALKCTVTAEKYCEEESIIVEVVAGDCSDVSAIVDAAAVAGTIADALPCPEDMPDRT